MTQNTWPRPNYNEADQPHFLFIITPPYSGSTALAQILNSSQRTMLLQRNGEGQWLIPGLCGPSRWDPTIEVDYESVRAVWLRTYQDNKSPVRDMDVIIEKSPPNMMRIMQLSALFPKHSFLANNRHPYACCSSTLYRDNDAEKMTAKQRNRALMGVAEKWLSRSRRIRQLVKELNIPLITYEQFCQSPSVLGEKLNLPEGVIDSLAYNAPIKVKDYPLQVVVNQNARQIAWLHSEEKELLCDIFAHHEELLAFFGYYLN